MATYARTCEGPGCGKTFTSSRRQARFCGPTCRSRAHRGKPAQPALSVVKQDADKSTVKDKPTATDPSTETQPAVRTAPPAPTYDTLEEQVRGELERLNALSTIAGMQAVRIAQQIDRGGDSGSAVVTLSKELTRLVGEAKVEAAPRNPDAVDDISKLVTAKLLRLVGEAG